MLTIRREIGAYAEQRLRALAALMMQGDAADPTHVVLTSVTWTEAYVDALLRALITQAGSVTSPFSREMLAELEDRIYGSWPERHAWLSEGFGISIAGRRASSDFLTLIELRNALVHGDGRLTERQSRDLSRMLVLETRLRTIYLVQVEGRRLHLNQATSALAVRGAQEYIKELDAEAHYLYPQATL